MVKLFSCVDSGCEHVASALHSSTGQLEQHSVPGPELVLACLQHCGNNNTDVKSWVVERKSKAIDYILQQKHNCGNAIDSSSLIANSQCQWVLALDKNKERWR